MSSSASKPFRFNYAVVCVIPDSLEDWSRKVLKKTIDINKARAQHSCLTETLRKLGISVLQLPPDEKYPLCAFVEDCAVVVNGTALICTPQGNDAERIGEVAAVRQTLKKDLGLKIVEIENGSALIEGGDVLFTGKEFFVGLSRVTNMNGAAEVAKAFPEYPCTIVPVPDGFRHLKNCVAMAANDCMVVSKDAICAKLFAQIQAKATFSYKVIRVEEVNAVSVLHANSMLIHHPYMEIQKSHGIFESALDARMECPLNELAKVQGTLHSCCILIGRYKHPKSFPTTLE